MLSVEDREQIRRAYYLEKKSIRQIAKEQRRSRKTVRKAIESAEAEYTLSKARVSPVLGPYMQRIDEMLQENERLPVKQQYTAKRIDERLREAGYQGSESGVRRQVGLRRRVRKQREVYLPLGYDPGADAQVDWGEAKVVMNGVLETAQLFVMRLCWSRRTLVQAYPSERQEYFFEGHVLAFQHFSGVPRRITYDNLKTAVYEHSDTPIRRHVKVRGCKSPYDGDWVYWVNRKERHPEIPIRVAKLLKRQSGRCVRCGLYFTSEDWLEVDHIIPTKMGGRDRYDNWQLLHQHCHHQKTAKDTQAQQSAVLMTGAN